ncbi:MAG: hypothetical protein IK090_03690 [Clostridia bacterium]|nr:hypothetical protein [Clostridia bacterium]
MFDRLTETFLTEFFLFDAVLGENYERRRLFSVLGDFFCIPPEMLDGLFEMTEREVVRDVTSADAYNRFRRVVQYNRLVGNEPCCDATENLLITMKGSAIQTAERYELIADRRPTGTLIAGTLTECAQTGNVSALRILGTLQCEGILTEKDVSLGMKNLTKAMRWGDITATLAVLGYSEKDRPETVKILNASVGDTPFKFFLPLAEKKYGVSANGEANEEVLLLRRAIAAKRLKRDVYDPMYARLLFSDLICRKEKERIVFSESREPASETCDLPLYLPAGDIPIDDTAFQNMAIQRDAEREKILQVLRNEDLRTCDSFRPLCLCSESDVVLDLYESALCDALKAANIERIEVGELKEMDVEATKNNVFVRGLSEQKPNVYLLVFKGDVSDAAANYVKMVLRSDERRKYRLKSPGVTMNLSSVLPVCICDKKNAKKIREYVDIVSLAPVKDEEKEAIIRTIVQQKKAAYSIKEITLTDDAAQRLCALPVESAENVLDRAIREHRVKGKTLEINADLIRQIDVLEDWKTVFGFGGAINENR